MTSSPSFIRPPIMALIFWLNLLEIACFNFVPIIYRLGTGTAAKADGRRFVGAVVVLLCLFGALLHKPHNIILTGMLLWSCDRVNVACDRMFGKNSVMMKTIAYYWLSQMFFYYQVFIEDCMQEIRHIKTFYCMTLGQFE